MHDFLRTAATIVIEKSHGKVRKDAVERVQEEKRPEKRVRQDKCQDTIWDRAVKRKVLRPDADTRKEGPTSDPYHGHGVQPDQLQEAWEKKRQMTRRKTAAQRMEEIRQRVMLKEDGKARGIRDYIELQQAMQTAVEPCMKQVTARSRQERTTWLAAFNNRKLVGTYSALPQKVGVGPGYGVGRVEPTQAKGTVG